MTEPRTHVEKGLGLLLLAALLSTCVLLLLPFASSILWAVVLTFSTWPVYQRILRAVGRRRTLAAALMALLLVAVILLPFVIIGLSLADNVQTFYSGTTAWFKSGPPCPEWLERVPMVGKQAAETWRSLAADSSKLAAAARPLIEPVTGVLLGAGVALARGVAEIGMSIFIAFFLYRDGAEAARRLSSAVERVAGQRGLYLLDVAGRTVRGVVYGILGTALVQAVMAGIGFAIAGVPGAALLALLTFCLSVLPVGPPLVWAPAAGWLFYQGSPGWGIFMIVWGVGVSSVDNIVKPWIISQGAPLPFLLILLGVLGGALTFGFIGFFVGPTVLAVGYRLVTEWVAERDRKRAAPAALGTPPAP